MLIIDRIEGQFALVEYGEGKVFNLPLSLLPSSVKEGDVLEINISINEDKTRERRKSIKNLMDDLFS